MGNNNSVKKVYEGRMEGKCQGKATDKMDHVVLNYWKALLIGEGFNVLRGSA